MIVVDNIGDHLIGNVFVKFKYEEDAINCMNNITHKRYEGRILMPEYSPVTDFANAKCK